MLGLNLPQKIEWPTWLLIAAVFIAWIALLANAPALNPWLLFGLLVGVMALFSSLCHELIHGHPSPHQRLNDAFGTLPIALFPYFEYKRSHLAHHIEERLTLPDCDPESFFITLQKWQNCGFIAKTIRLANMTLLGRLLLGPAFIIAGIVQKMGQQLLAGPPRARLHWMIYVLGVVVVLSVASAAGIPLFLYIAAAYFSLSVIALRSFYEHRPHIDAAKRTVVVKSCHLFRLLYLSNNLHAVHHRHPKLPWYQLYGEYRLNAPNYLHTNGQFYFSGYRRWLKYLIKPVAHPVHPHCSPSKWRD